jgi:sterol desaturase/sphingolipid hydroxylase (fatty acid hydroxylase superfamily)
VQPTRTEQLKASPRMFESSFFDRLSRVHPLVPLAIFGPTIAILLVLAATRLEALQLVLLVAGGYLFWTLTEYWMHRIVFHFEPEEGLGARFHWIIHGVHHEHPNDPKRLVMPPGVSIPLSLAFFGLFWLVLGLDQAFAFGAGFWAGYLAYDSIHYHLHHHAPRTALGRWLRELHMRHHFQDETAGFGISAPWWDRVFRTAVPKVNIRR